MGQQSVGEWGVDASQKRNTNMGDEGYIVLRLEWIYQLVFGCFTLESLPSLIPMLLPISSRVASQAARLCHTFHVLLPHWAFMVEKIQVSKTF